MITEETELRALLKQKLLNKKQLANDIGMNYYDLVRFLNAGQSLSSPAIIKVNKYLGL